jgi:prolipoprotein diacylglyceryltransferase
MRQVLFYIPLKADWLPANLPLPLFVFLVGLVLAGVVWLVARRVTQPQLRENLRGATLWVAGFGALAALVSYFGANKLPQGLPIYGFGMMLFLAFVVCTWLATRRAVSEGVPREYVQDVTIWLFIGGLIGARFTFLKVENDLSLSETIEEFYKIWDGGIVLYGSVVGGLISYYIAYFLFFRKFGQPTLKLADILAPSIAVGICLGRFGCFLNGCCYGQVACPTCAVYAVHFPLSAPARDGLVKEGYQTPVGFTLDRNQPQERGARVGLVDPDSDAYKVGLRSGDLIVMLNDAEIKDGDYEIKGETKHLRAVDVLTYNLVSNWPRGENKLRLTVKHDKDDKETELPTIEPRTLGLHPTQLYEVVSMGLLFLVLTAYYPLRRRQGQVIALLMVGYGIHRYLNELLRDDPRPVGFERYTSVILVLAGIALWTYLQLRPIPAQTESKETAKV